MVIPDEVDDFKELKAAINGAARVLSFECVKSDGAFYLFPKSLEADDYAFCRKAVEYNLIMVQGSEFGYPGHVRISYCVSTEQIEKALPAFAALAAEYKK